VDLKHRIDLPPISPLVRRRLLTALPTLFVIITVTFVLARAAPGGPFRGEEAVPEAVRENLEARYGLDRSIVIQYLRFWGNVLTGSLGPSFSHPERSALQVLLAGLIPSTVIGLAALFVALLIGLGGGTLACVHPRLGPVVSGASLAALALPVFVLGPLLVRSLALGLGWFPSGLLESPLHVVLPALTLGIPVGGALASAIADPAHGSVHLPVPRGPTSSTPPTLGLMSANSSAVRISCWTTNAKKGKGRCSASPASVVGASSTARDECRSSILSSVEPRLSLRLRVAASCQIASISSSLASAITGTVIEMP